MWYLNGTPHILASTIWVVVLPAYVMAAATACSPCDFVFRVALTAIPEDNFGEFGCNFRHGAACFARG